MIDRLRVLRPLAFLVAVSLLLVSCQGAFSREYEYDEDVYIDLDGSATVYVNASIPALVALRGFDLDTDPRARFDRSKFRALYDTPVSRVESVTSSRRDNRRYVHLRLDVPDIRRLHEAPPFAWSRYELTQQDDLVVYRQQVGPAAGEDVHNASWRGDELVAFRFHLPSRVPFFNAPSREIERGNIIRWEQTLADRRRGEPVDIVVHMEPQSILVRTLLLFGLTIVLAALTFVVAIWWVRRRAAGGAPQGPAVPGP